MKMKKVLMLIIAAMLLLTVVSCGNAETSKSEAPTETPTVSAPATEEPTATPTPDKPEKITYTVTVKDNDGNSVAGVEVQICVGDICMKPNATGEDGTVTFSISDPGEVLPKVQINGENSTAGYEYPTEKTEIPTGQTGIEITVTKTAA